MAETRVERYKEYRDSIASTNVVQAKTPSKNEKKGYVSQTDTLPMDDVISQINQEQTIVKEKKKMDKTTLAVILSIAGIAIVVAVLVIIGINLFK